MLRPCLLGCASFAALTVACSSFAQDSAAPPAVSSAVQPAMVLPQIVVSGRKRPKKPPAAQAARPQPAAVPAAPVASTPGSLPGPSPVKDRYQLPQTVESVTAERLQQTTNVIDSEDAVKYLPSLSLRKRNAGDNQTVLASRVWGLNSSARTLVYADDILLSALIANNNTTGTPRWGLIAPEEIKRVDFLYGPFAAAYPGNSMGGVLQFTTRMPEKFEKTLSQSESFQNFSLYDTHGTYRTDQTSASIGDRWGKLSAFASFNYQNSFSQPLGFATATAPQTAALPAGTTGVIPQLNRTGAVANVLGATGLLHTEQMNAKGKVALDITPWMTATYTLGFWSNDEKSRVQTYLRDAASNQTFGPQTSNNPFASGFFNLNQQNLANALSLKTDTKGNFDWDLAFTRFDYLQDIQRNPFNVSGTGASFTDTGKIARMDGSNWTTADAKGIWRPQGPGGAHEVSFGYHFDTYVLNNPTYQTPTAFGGGDTTGALYTLGQGKTQTQALWLQDAWRFAPMWKLTLGGRWEAWRAFDGFNVNTVTNNAGAITGTASVNQAAQNASRFSPKAALSFEPNKEWEYTASVGIANRFPTVTELYQISTSTPGQANNPNPNLKPEQSLVTELAAIRKFADGKVRLSLFQENTRDMIIAQQTTLPGSTTLASFNVNVDEARSRGVELAVQKDNLFIPRLELFGSLTYVDSRILSNPTFVSTTGTTSTGKLVPNVPKWRATFGGTYRPTDAWSFTMVGRYQSKIYSTLDNTDTVAHVYQAFDPYLVFDMRVQYRVSERGSLAFGIDNIFNEKYFLFHPFPQRTYVIQGRLTF